MLVELISQNGRDSCATIGIVVPIKIVEIASHGKRQFGGDGHGVHGGNALSEASPVVGMFAKLCEDRRADADIQSLVKVPCVPSQVVEGETPRPHLTPVV